jgi:hypothetical protein
MTYLPPLDSYIVANGFTINIGDIVCSSNIAFTFPIQVVTATSANLANSGGIVGIALTHATSNQMVLVEKNGIIANGITGLGSGTANFVAVNSSGRCVRVTSAGNGNVIGQCDTHGNLTLNVSQPVLSTISDLQSVPTPTNLQTVTVQGVLSASDGGGSSFYFEVAPNSRKITAASPITLTITSTAQNIPGTDLRVVVQTSSAHGLSNNTSVNITGCSDSGANGNFIVSVVDSTHLLLLGSISQTNGSGGTLTTTILTISGHPYQNGQRLAITSVVWSNSNNINGTYDLIGSIGTNTISIPFAPTSGTYVSGGMTGDNALIIPATDGSGVWHRLTPNNEVRLEWFGAPLDGVNDDAPALMAAIAAGTSSGVAGGFKILIPANKPGINAPLFKQNLQPLESNAAVRVSRSVVIQGAGQDSTTIYTSAGISAFVFEASSTSQTGTNSDNPCLRDLSISGAFTAPPGYILNHSYNVGDKVYARIEATSNAISGIPTPAYDLRVYFQCERAGTSASTLTPITGHFNPIPGTLTDEITLGVSGGPLWRCKWHGGVFSKSASRISNVAVNLFSTSAFLYQGSGSATPPAGPSNTDGAILKEFSTLFCGCGLAVGPGIDTNSAVYGPGFVTDAGFTGLGFPQPSSAGVFNHSFGGCTFRDIICQNPNNLGFLSDNTGGLSIFIGCHDESTYGCHFVNHCIVMGGQFAGSTSFTSTTAPASGMIGCDNSQTWSGTNYKGSTAVGGVTASRSLFPRNVTDSDYLSSSDDPGILSLIYGHAALGGAGWWTYHFNAGFDARHYWAHSNRFATYDGTHLLGALPWLGWGVGRGQDGGSGQAWPDFIEFDDTKMRDSAFIRSGYRTIGDRMRTFGDLGTVQGGIFGKAVLVDGYEGPAWTASTTINPPNFAALIVGKGFTQCIRPSNNAPVAQRNKRFAVSAVTGNAQTGGSEPDWSTATIIGSSTITDNNVTWLYVGTAPSYGAVITQTPDNALQQVTTTNNTQTVCATFNILSGETRAITSQVIGNQVSGTNSPDSYWEIRRMVVRNNNGSITTVLADTQVAVQANANGSSWSTTLVVSGTTVVHKVTGDNSKTIDWGVYGGAVGVL